MNESMNRKGRSSNADTTESMDPVSMLKKDHSNVKKLFEQFEDTDDERDQKEIAKKAMDELKVHAAIEEEIFYPGVSAMVDDAEVMCEATEEHHVVHVLIDELENEKLDHDTFHAKFIVLAENVRHHIKEEEGEMMPKIDGDEADLAQLGTRMAERKQELMENPGALDRKTDRTAERKTAQSRQSSPSPKAARGTRKAARQGSKSPSPRASR